MLLIILHKITLHKTANMFYLTNSTAILIDFRPCQHDNGYMDGRSQIKVHSDERTQVHSAQPSLAVTHPSRPTNRAQPYFSDRVTEQALVATADP